MNERFLDTNILIRHFVQDHDNHSPRSSSLISEIYSGNQVVHICETVVFETVFTLGSRYKVPRDEISTVMTAFISASSVRCPRKPELIAALALWVDERSLSFADCYHLVLTRALNLTEIYSFDKKMNRYLEFCDIPDELF
jgi:predicted nucleic-acid-binding protein